jgi:hypothetical protein
MRRHMPENSSSSSGGLTVVTMSCSGPRTRQRTSACLSSVEVSYTAASSEMAQAVWSSRESREVACVVTREGAAWERFYCRATAGYLNGAVIVVCVVLGLVAGAL